MEEVYQREELLECSKQKFLMFELIIHYGQEVMMQ